MVLRLLENRMKSAISSKRAFVFSGSFTIKNMKNTKNYVLYMI